MIGLQGEGDPPKKNTKKQSQVPPSDQEQEPSVRPDDGEGRQTTPLDYPEEHSY